MADVSNEFYHSVRGRPEAHRATIGRRRDAGLPGRMFGGADVRIMADGGRSIVRPAGPAGGWRTIGGLAVVLAILPGAGCGDTTERAAVQMVTALDRGKVTGTRGTMETIATGLRVYAVDHSGYPETDSLDDAMAALVPAHLRAPIDSDAWGRRLSYRGEQESYRLSSSGQDGEFGTADDIVLEDGRFTASPKVGGF